MDKCECYHEEYKKHPLYNMVGNPTVDHLVGVCWGTKECEECTCNGDTNKCNFYPEKRKENKKMNTAEMWLKAQKDKKMYCSADIAYSVDYGFVDLNNLKDIWEPNNFCTIDNIMNLDWQEVMTISEAEEKLGVRIVLD